jgi:PIN domain
MIIGVCMKEKTNYILIDYKNVQPKNLLILNGHPVKVFIFVGANQAKIPFEVASALQTLGDNGKYVKISGIGSNALDFHIAFYIGQLAARDSSAYFHVISKDTGFDPLIKHLKERRIFAQRRSELAEIPLLHSSNACLFEEKIEVVIKSLAARGHSRPRRVKTLVNSNFSKSPGRKRVGRYKTRGEYDPCTLGCGIPAADGLVLAHPLPASIHPLPTVNEKLL